MTYTKIFSENFEGNWPDTWGGQPRNGYPANQGNDPDKEARLLIRQGEHYGSDFRKPIGGRVRKGKMRYLLYLSGDWNPSHSGKLPGVFDQSFEPKGYGGNKPNPDGASIRTWFGFGAQNRHIGMYYYHKGQAGTYGDHVVTAVVPLWTEVWVEIEWDFDEGWIKQTVTGKLSGTVLGTQTRTISVSADTAIDTMWLCAYHGGATQVAPSNMAADIDDMEAWKWDAAPPPPSDGYAFTREQLNDALADLAIDAAVLS